MIILDLFSGTGSSTVAFHERGHRVRRIELDTQHEADLYADVTKLKAAEVINLCGGRPYFVWASPPCTAFSVASIGKYWSQGGDDPRPKHPKAVEAEATVRATLALIEALKPRYWLMENPRGMLRTLKLVRHLQRWTVTYCQYGEERMKPTDLWGVMPAAWVPRPPCKNGDTCHVSAPRGSRTGTQGIGSVVDRARVPHQLSLELVNVIDRVITSGDERPTLTLEMQ